MKLKVTVPFARMESCGCLNRARSNYTTGKYIEVCSFFSPNAKFIH